MLNAITNLLESLKEHQITPEPNDYVLLRKLSHNPVPFETKNFKSIKTITNPSRLSFIDGGNQEIISAPNYSVHFIRIANVTYKNNQKTSQKIFEFFLLVTLRRNEDKFYYEAKQINVKEDLQLQPGDLIFEKEDISLIGDFVRRTAELRAAKLVADKLQPNDILVLDGTLRPYNYKEILVFEELFNKAKSNNVVVASLSKSTRTITNNGHSLIYAISSLANLQPPWYYYPVANFSDIRYPCDLFVVNLNEFSKHTFLLEVSNKTQYDINLLLSSLSQNSKDFVFPGYPYGLIMADKLARVSNKEAEYIRTMMKNRAGAKWEDIQKQINIIHSHDILDKIEFFIQK